LRVAQPLPKPRLAPLWWVAEDGEILVALPTAGVIVLIAGLAGGLVGSIAVAAVCWAIPL
jgi:hypothetical protein